MVDTVKGSRQVEQGQHCQIAGVQCQEYVGNYLQNSSLCRVVCSVRRLKPRSHRARRVAYHIWSTCK